MKLTCLCAVIASVAATAPLRIELDLTAYNAAVHYEPQGLSRHTLGSSMYAAAPGVASEDRMRRHDWSQRCPASRSTTALTCPLPKAKSFNHKDAVVDADITPTVFLVDKDGDAAWRAANPAGQQLASAADIDYTKRSMYVIKFDAIDEVGNKAEQIVFALILDDTTAPAITQCTSAIAKIEAKTDEASTLCWDDTAIDAIDGSVTGTITYEITSDDGTVVLQDGTRAQAAAAFGTSTAVGTYAVALRAHDHAGGYGHAGADNVVFASRQIKVVDSTKPIITLHGSDPFILECTQPYADINVGGATVADTYDGTDASADIGTCTVPNTPASSVNKCFRARSTVDKDVVGNYFVRYTAHDAHKNEAEQVTRIVKVRDRTPPKVELIGANPLVYRASSGSSLVDPGITCVDACDKDVPYQTSKSWDRTFNKQVTGSYHVTYTCTDKSGNSASVTREVQVVDQDAPVLTLVGDETVTVEARAGCPGSASAAPTLCYDESRDGGARCMDWHEGTLTPTLSGNTVNMAQPGSYVVQYDCKDSQNNQAAPAVYRTITVQDTTCPTITINGASELTVEAGFKYTDAHATASDSLDGVIAPSKIWTDGDTVDVSLAFQSRRSCKEIKESYAAAPTGEYWVTVWSGAKFQRKRVWCDMHTTHEGSATGFTYLKCDSCDKVEPYGSEQGSCSSLGMEMASFHSSAVLENAARAHYGDVYFPQAGSKSDSYLCAINDLHRPSPGFRPTEEVNSGAAKGIYIIVYHVSDAAGNTESSCDDSTAPRRTVTVRDTLPPVISLKWANKIVHVSAHADDNPAGISDQFESANIFLQGETMLDSAGNEHTVTGVADAANLMAEAQRTGMSVWVLAGVASAFAGVALLVVGNRNAPAEALLDV